MGKFSDLVGSWGNETEARLLAVWRGSIDMLADEMTTTRSNGGRLPHLTGNLMRSLLASTAAMPPTGGADDLYDGQDIGSVTASLTIDQTVWLGYQAIYARRQNYGFVGEDELGRTYNQEGAHFVEAAILAWPTIVELVAEDIRAKVMARG